jgi:hypothetical protein
MFAIATGSRDPYLKCSQTAVVAELLGQVQSPFMAKPTRLGFGTTAKTSTMPKKMLLSVPSSI